MKAINLLFLISDIQKLFFRTALSAKRPQTQNKLMMCLILLLMTVQFSVWRMKNKMGKSPANTNVAAGTAACSHAPSEVIS